MNPKNDTWIGVLGGGQLGRMLALDARRMGFKVLKWTGGDVSGAANTADLVFEETFDDEQAFSKFIERVDVATVEFENVPKALLESVEERLPLMPQSSAIATCQHREREKQFLVNHKFPCAAFKTVASAEELILAVRSFKTDAILKTAEFGYDGKGQQSISHGSSREALSEHWTGFSNRKAVLEVKIDLAAEFSVLVVRGKNGEVATFDPAENQHSNHILDVSIIPARLNPDQLKQAREISIEIAKALDYVGVLAIEFFLSKDGRLLVNELAPRPHNSGHHTINACETSQFEQQLRAITGLPLGSTRLIRPAVMWNLLGDLWEDPHTAPDWNPILATPGASLHLYGKSEARPGRKMGHATFLADTTEEAMSRTNACRKYYGTDPTQSFIT
ncbi:5-(carboxyamino)imidazole ribonucleotide synthase [bacterium]|jgi:5-(carboxyamino)imidazole ribonucleotide synthase|nr:5-(carboxyamino)imidazole ribonucleotide synthase [bacterium]